MAQYEQSKKAAVWMTINQPFFSSILLKRQMISTDAIPTAATDGVTIMFNPDFFEKQLSQEEVVAVMAHEVMHIVFKHMWRRGVRDPQKWNIACDFAINLTLKDSGFQLPACGLLDEQYRGMTAEQIYELLPDDMSGMCDMNSPDPGGMGGVAEPKDKSEAAQAQAEAEIQMDIAAAAEAAKSCGNMPAGLSGIISEALTPKVDWRAMLWDFVSTIGKNDYSFKRPNRPYMQQGIMVPGLYSEEIGKIGVLVDTSGSVSQRELEQFCGELTGIMETYPTTLEVVYVDTQVNNEETFTPNDLPIVMNIKGRGGTDFVPGFAHLLERHNDLECIIYLTDMECNSFPDPPPIPTLWISTGSVGHGSQPPFGTLTCMG